MKKAVIINNWYVDSKSISGEKGIQPYIKNDELNIELDIPNELLSVFGYISNGTELGITGVYRFDNIDKQVRAIIEIISDNLKYELSQPRWYHIRKYLSEYKGRMRLGKIIPLAKIDKLSIKRVINIVNDEYQPIHQSVNNSKTLRERIEDRISVELRRQKESGKKFISDDEIDELIDQILKEEIHSKK